MLGFLSSVLGGRTASPITYKVRSCTPQGLGCEVVFAPIDLAKAAEITRKHEPQGIRDMRILAEDFMRTSTTWAESQKYVAQEKELTQRYTENQQALRHVNENITEMIQKSLARGDTGEVTWGEKRRRDLLAEAEFLELRLPIVRGLVTTSAARVKEELGKLLEPHRKKMVADLLAEQDRLKVELAEVAGPVLFQLAAARRAFLMVSDYGFSGRQIDNAVRNQQKRLEPEAV